MLRKVLKAIDKTIGVICVVLFSVAVLSLFYQVIMRYVFHNANIWSEELAVFSNIWMCSLGCALAFRRYKHITITTLSDMIPWKIRRYIDVFSYVLILVFLFYAFKSSFPLIKAQWNVYTTGFRMRQGALYLSIPISSVFMAFSVLECIYDKIKNFGVEPVKTIDTEGD